MIDNLVNLGSQNHTIKRRKSVLYAIKQDVCHISILKKSPIRQKTYLKIDWINVLTKKPLNILQILKEKMRFTL